MKVPKNVVNRGFEKGERGGEIKKKGKILTKLGRRNSSFFS